MSNKAEQRPKTAAVLPNNNLTGVPNVFRRMFGIIVTSSERQRIDWLEEVKDTVNSYFPKAH